MINIVNVVARRAGPVVTMVLRRSSRSGRGRPGTPGAIGASIPVLPRVRRLPRNSDALPSRPGRRIANRSDRPVFFARQQRQECVDGLCGQRQDQPLPYDTPRISMGPPRAPLMKPPSIRAFLPPPLQKGLETREFLHVGGGMVLKEDISCLLIPPTPVRR